MPTTENHVLKQLPLEATFYWMLKKEFPGVKAVHFPAAGTVGMICCCLYDTSLRMRGAERDRDHDGSRRNKIMIVVDEDVDLYDMEKVLWAIATRSQADEDVVIFPRLVATAMDPSVRKLRVAPVWGSMRPVRLASHFQKWSRCRGRRRCRWMI